MSHQTLIEKMVLLLVASDARAVTKHAVETRNRLILLDHIAATPWPDHTATPGVEIPAQIVLQFARICGLDWLDSPSSNTLNAEGTKRKICFEARYSAMRGKYVVFSLLTVLSSTVYAGDIFRCVAANGDVTFTNTACPADSKAQHFSSYEPVPDTPYDANANAAAASALEAREAAREAKEAAYQAEVAYEQAQAAQSEHSYNGTEYEAGWIEPYYPAYGSRFNDRHHRHHPQHPIAGNSTAHSSHLAAPRAPVTSFAFRR